MMDLYIIVNEDIDGNYNVLLKHKHNDSIFDSKTAFNDLECDNVIKKWVYDYNISDRDIIDL